MIYLGGHGFKKYREALVGTSVLYLVLCPESLSCQSMTLRHLALAHGSKYLHTDIMKSVRDVPDQVNLSTISSVSDWLLAAGEPENEGETAPCGQEIRTRRS